jgi:hypothetical protein
VNTINSSINPPLKNHLSEEYLNSSISGPSVQTGPSFLLLKDSQKENRPNRMNIFKVKPGSNSSKLQGF